MKHNYSHIIVLLLCAAVQHQAAQALWPFDAKDPKKISIPQAVAKAGEAVIKAADDGFTLSIETPDMKKTIAELKDLQLKPVVISIDIPKNPVTLEHKHTIPSLPQITGTLEIKPIPELTVSIDHFPNGAQILKLATLYFGSALWTALGIKLLHDMALDPSNRTLFVGAVMDGAFIAAAALFYAAHRS